MKHGKFNTYEACKTERTNNGHEILEVQRFCLFDSYCAGPFNYDVSCIDKCPASFCIFGLASSSNSWKLVDD